MACYISYKEEDIPLNNSQFSSLIEFLIDVASKLADEKDKEKIEKIIYLRDEVFWPGRGIIIENDITDIEDQKFWSTMLFEVAREIFDRSIGEHKYSFWQSQRIYQAYGVARLFKMAVNDKEPRWTAVTRDTKDFDREINGKS